MEAAMMLANCILAFVSWAKIDGVLIQVDLVVVFAWMRMGIEDDADRVVKGGEGDTHTSHGSSQWRNNDRLPLHLSQHPTHLTAVSGPERIFLSAEIYSCHQRALE